MILYNFISFLLTFLFYLIENPIEVYNYMYIIKGLIVFLSKINISYYRLKNLQKLDIIAKQLHCNI